MESRPGTIVDAQQPYFTKYNAEVHAKIVELAEIDLPKIRIAAIIGVNQDTLHNWLKKGRDEPNLYPEFALLYEEYSRAVAECHERMLKTVVQTATGFGDDNWRAALEFLQRRDPENFGKKETRVHEGGEQVLPQINVLVLNDPDARRKHQDLLRSVDSASPGIALGPGVDSERTDET